MNYVKLVGPVTCTVQNILDQDFKNIPVRRINFVCDTTLGAVVINLPSIANMAFNDVEFTVAATIGGVPTNAITINAFAGDKVNTGSSLSVVLNNEKLWGIISANETASSHWAVFRTGCCDYIEITEYFTEQTGDITLQHAPASGFNMLVYKGQTGILGKTTATGTRD